jgi:hypothetical protein
VAFAESIGVVIELAPAESKTIDCKFPKLSRKFTVAPGVPLNEIWAVFPEQIVVVPEMVAVGKAFTVTITESVSVLTHEFAPDEVTFTKV